MAALPVIGQIANSSGAVQSGAEVTVYLRDTSTLATIYADAGLFTATTNPAIADSLGIIRFYVDDTIDLDYVVKTSGGASTLAALQQVDATGRNLIPIFSLGAETALAAISDDITIVADAQTSGYLEPIANDLDVGGNGFIEDVATNMDYVEQVATGSIGLLPPVAFASGLSATSSRFTVTYQGNTYHAAPAETPFTTTSSFDSSQWVLVTPRKFDSVSDVISDTSVDYSTGDFIQTSAESVVYQVAASGATDHDLTTAGGVKLYVSGSRATMKAFGATGDGSTLDDTEYGKALTWVNGSTDRVLDGEGKTYAISTTQSVTGRADIRNLKLYVSADVTALTASPTLTGPYTVATDYAEGDLTIDLTGDPLPSAPERGDWFKIISNATDPGSRDKGSETSKYRCAEWFQVSDGSTTTNLVLSAPLIMHTGISPTSTAGNEARIAAYTTAMNARVVRIDMDEARDFRMENVSVEYESGHEGVSGWTEQCMEIAGYVNPVIKGISSNRSYGIVLRESCVGLTVSDAVFRSGPEVTTNSQIGYGVAATGSYGTTIRGLDAIELRHGFTTDARAMADDVTDTFAILQAGPAIYPTVYDLHGRTSYTPANLDTHQDTIGATFHAPKLQGGAANIASVRGRGVTINNLWGRGSAEGIKAITEKNTGDTDDDNYVNGREIDDWTFAAYNLSDVEAVDTCITNDKTGLSVHEGRWRLSDGINFLISYGGITTITGNHHLVASGGSNGDQVLYQLSDDGSDTPWDGAHTYIAKNAHIILDLTDGPSTLTLFRTVANTSFKIYGYIKFIIPTGATYTFHTGAGDIEIDRSGLVEVIDAAGTVLESHRGQYYVEQTTTSGTSVTFSDLPGGLTEIILEFDAVSKSGTSDVIFRLGTSGGLESTGYVSVFESLSETSGFRFDDGLAADEVSGALVLRRLNTASNEWSASGVFANSAGSSVSGAGRKSLSGALTQIRVLSSNGSDTFDNGKITLSYR